MARASDPTSAPAFKHKLRVPKARRGPARVFLGTRKGIFRIDVDERREGFSLLDPSHLGCTAYHVVADPRDRRYVLAAIRTPEGRPTVLVSEDGGERWVESSRPPAFGRSAEGDPSLWERTVNQVFWLTPGHASEYRTWYCGTSPKGLFRSTDGGHTWSAVAGLHRSPSFDEWTAPGTDSTPDGPKLHSVLVDPRTPDRLLLAMSEGGVLESVDGGDTWARLPDECDAGADPHALSMNLTNPDVLWLQSHFGVYRMDLDAAREWRRVGPRDRRGRFHDAGFPIVVHPADPDMAWIMPMDDSEAWSRTPRDGRAAVWRTSDGGASWESFSEGLPDHPVWWTVKRQCLAVDGHDPIGVVFGTSTGEVWASRDEGAAWRCVARGLPHVYSVEVG